MVKKSKENVEIIAQKIFLELHLGNFKGDLNVHDLFKKKFRFQSRAVALYLFWNKV